MTVQKMIFCLSTGRCGTMYLQMMMDTIPDVVSLHEPQPCFHDNTRKDYEGRKQWLEETKIPYILGLAQTYYIETSNQFSRGFVEPMLELGYVPDVIVIRRNVSDVALSAWRHHMIPGRTLEMNKYNYFPGDDEVFLKFPNCSRWTDYMCCYWHVLEMEYRMNKYSQVIKEAGGIVVETRTEKLVTEEGFMEIINQLGLSLPEHKLYNKLWNIKFNETRSELKLRYPGGDIATQEKWVREALNLEV